MKHNVLLQIMKYLSFEFKFSPSPIEIISNLCFPFKKCRRIESIGRKKIVNTCISFLDVLKVPETKVNMSNEYKSL